MTRVLIYARVSTEDQLEKYGLPTQLAACREHARKLDWQVIGEITDDGISGTILERPGLDRVRKAVREGQADAILMLDVDRLSRELAHLLILKPEIEKRAQLEFVVSKFEDSPSGRLFFGIRGVIAQYERELTRERTMRGKRARAESGLIVGGRVPYGYLYADGKLAEDPERASVARRIFAEYESGLSIRRIASNLRESGAPTWRGGKWAKSSVARILANETYAGVAHYGTHRREGALLRLRAPGDRIALAVPALVSREQWERVQVRLNSNPQNGRPAPNHLLRGVLFCASCGRRMAAESSRKSRAYRCTGRDRLADANCRAHANSAAVDAAVWNSLAAAFADTRFVREALKRRESELREIDPSKLADLSRRAAKLKRKEETILGAMLDPDLVDARPRMKAEYKAAVDERRLIEAEAAELGRSRAALQSADSWLEETAAAIARFVAQLTDTRMKQEFVRRLVTRAEWDGKAVKMSCFIAPKLATSSTRCVRPPRPPAARA